MIMMKMMKIVMMMMIVTINDIRCTEAQVFGLFHQHRLVWFVKGLFGLVPRVSVSNEYLSGHGRVKPRLVDRSE